MTQSQRILRLYVAQNFDLDFITIQNVEDDSVMISDKNGDSMILKLKDDTISDSDRVYAVKRGFEWMNI